MEICLGFSMTEYEEQFSGKDHHIVGSGNQGLADEDPDLYGMLLLADQKIGNVGTVSIWIWALLGLGSCVGLHMRWFDALTGMDCSAFRGFGVYMLICTTAFTLFATIDSWQERSVYYSMRNEILNALQKNGRSVYSILTTIQSDELLKNIAGQLKDDRNIQVSANPADAVRF
jgi:hypothetical protein